MTPEMITEIFKRFQLNNQRPNTELNFNSNFELLIAVILSAQATDKRVNIITSKLFSVANTPEKIEALGEIGLEHYIKSINHYHSKASYIIRTCRILIEKYNSQVPSQREALESLPGVGRKTANVVLNTVFGHETIAVDTHVFRVANRLGLATSKKEKEVEIQLLKNVPPEFRKDAHHWLVLHGRYVCIARKPKCLECFLHDLCAWPFKTVE